MKTNLEELFHQLNEEDEDIIDVVDDADETVDNGNSAEAEKKQRWKDQAAERAKKAAEFGKVERKINKNYIIKDLWDQVYCSLTDSVDNRVYNILGKWSGKLRYPVTHVMPSSTASAFLPKGFKTKGGYNDIIIFDSSANIDTPFMDNDEDEKRRNKKNRRYDFEYAKQVAEVYHLPYQELENAFVIYIPKSNYLNAETLDERYFLSLFPDTLITDYLNNLNLKTEFENGVDFPYDVSAYLTGRVARKDREKFIKENEDLWNWVTDTADQIFYDRFGVRSGDNDYTEKEQKLFNLLVDKVAKVAGTVLDQLKKVSKNEKSE